MHVIGKVTATIILMAYSLLFWATAINNTLQWIQTMIIISKVLNRSIKRYFIYAQNIFRFYNQKLQIALSILLLLKKTELKKKYGNQLNT